MEVLMEI